MLNILAYYGEEESYFLPSFTDRHTHSDYWGPFSKQIDTKDMEMKWHQPTELDLQTAE